MTRFQICASIVPLLESYHDDELTVEQQIAVEVHLAECSYCADQVEALRRMRQMLRTTPIAPAGNLGDQVLGEVMRSVVSRVKVERDQSLHARVARMFEDLHLVWAGLAGTTATATCAAIVVSVITLAPAWRADSLAGVLAALAAPPGSDRNPVRTDQGVALPWVKSDEDIMPAVVAALPETTEDPVSLAVAGVLTQEGRVSNASLLTPGRYDVADARRVIDAVTLARFQPAQRGGAPVAVSLIWVLEQTTVKGKTSS